MDETLDLRKQDALESESGSFVNNFSQDALSWATHLSPPPRERILYLALGLGIGAIAVAILMQDFLLTFLLALAALVLILHGFKEHKPHEITVHATGLSIDDEHHHYADMKSFWIEYEPYIKELSIEFRKTHRPRMRIPLEDTDPIEVRRVIISYVPEKPHESSFLDHLVRILGI